MPGAKVGERIICGILLQKTQGGEFHERGQRQGDEYKMVMLNEWARRMLPHPVDCRCATPASR